MRFRKLRIAFSATCLILCVLLIVLCVRSYWWADLLAYRRGQTNVSVATGRGIASLNWHSWNAGVRIGNKLGWELFGGPAGTIDSRMKPLEWKRDRDPNLAFGLLVSVPCWCCVAFFATLSVLPWIPQLRLRYSLRTLLIVTTLIAVVLGLIGWLIK
jgi:hypothetical protein